MRTTLRIQWTTGEGRISTRRFHIDHDERLSRETIEERGVEALERYLGHRRWESLSICAAHKHLRIPGKVYRELELAERAANMGDSCGLSDETKEACRLYLQTWVAARLRRVLSWADGIDGVCFETDI